jgi:transposase InsO family protein
VSLAFAKAALAVSMGSRGDAYDNAVAETFFATLKKELVNRRINMLSPANNEQLRLSPLGG